MYPGPKMLNLPSHKVSADFELENMIRNLLPYELVGLLVNESIDGTRNMLEVRFHPESDVIKTFTQQEMVSTYLKQTTLVLMMNPRHSSPRIVKKSP